MKKLEKRANISSEAYCEDNNSHILHVKVGVSFGLWVRIGLLTACKGT